MKELESLYKEIEDSRDSILSEITDCCENCSARECCQENECVLFRIEKIIEEKGKKMKDINEYLKEQKEKYNGVYEEVTKEMVIEEFNKIIEMIERNK